MNELLQFLEQSYTAYQATENAKNYLISQGFQPLDEGESWNLTKGNKYFVTRNGSSIIAFTLGKKNKFQIVASHTDSPCFKLKERAPFGEPFTRLNVESYGGGIWYTFFDRPLKIAGRIIKKQENVLKTENFVSDYLVTIPSLAVHQNREVNEKFSPDLQIDTLPLYALGKVDEEEPYAFDLFAVCAEKPFVNGKNGEFISAPRVDNLTSVYASLRALASTNGQSICVAACLDSEEIGSRTRQGAGGDFFKSTLERIAFARGMNEEDFKRAISTSFLLSVDNAHSLHPNRPEKSDVTNRAVMGGGVVIKIHSGGAYTTDALTAAIVKSIFDGAGVKHQTFFNRSNMKSGSTLGAISIGQTSIPSADIGLAQLAMHSAVETFCKADYEELEKGLTAFYQSDVCINEQGATV